MYEDSHLDASYEERFDLFDESDDYPDDYAMDFYDDEPDIYAGTYSEE